MSHLLSARRLFAPLLTLTFSVVLIGCEKPDASATAAPMTERPPTPVVITPAVAQDVPVYLDEIGRCAARESVAIQPQVSGRITQIHFQDGADLKKGDVLFTIDPRPFEAALQQAEATLAQNRANLELAQIEFKRVDALLPTKAVSKQEWENKKATLASSEAQVQGSEANVKTARLNLEYCTIVSPIDGRAGQRLVDVGKVVTANMPGGETSSLLLIQRLDPIYADFAITENNLTDVQRHANKGTLKVEVRLPDETGAGRTGELTFLDNNVQEVTGTLKLRATLPNADHHFWPGRFVKVRLILDTLRNAVLIPAGTPLTSAQGPFVYVVKDDNTAEMRVIKPGQRQGDMLVILDGVKAGERVITTGQFLVQPGGKVHVTDPAAAVGSPAGAPAAAGENK